MSVTESKFEFEKSICLDILKLMANGDDKGDQLILDVHYKSKENSPPDWLSPQLSSSWKKWWSTVPYVLYDAGFFDKPEAPDTGSKNSNYTYRYAKFVITKEGKQFLKESSEEQNQRLDAMWEKKNVEQNQINSVSTEEFYIAIPKWHAGIPKWSARKQADPRLPQNSQRFLAELYFSYPQKVTSEDLAKMTHIKVDDVWSKLLRPILDHLAPQFLKLVGLPELSNRITKLYLSKSSVFYQDSQLVPNFYEALKKLNKDGRINIDDWKSCSIIPSSLKKAPKTNPTDSSKHNSSQNVSTLKEIMDKTIAEIKKILVRKSQVILYGPPGTGKTYMANEYLKSVFNGLNEGEEKQDYKRWDDKYVSRCTFHPEYGYEHFIEGYRPKKNGGGDQLGFELKPGIFKELCKKAQGDGEHKYYLIIDEINRGDIPRIFGELITLIEKDKRSPEKGTYLPHSGEEEKFYVPPNVCIIATMNTADRSIALLDTALRRRFGFLEMKPEYHHSQGLLVGKLKDEKGNPCDLSVWFKALNDKLHKQLEGRHDAEHILIGHSYFIPPKDEKTGEQVELTLTDFNEIIRYEILSLIQEYCYENKEARESLEKFIFDTTGVSTHEKTPSGSASHASQADVDDNTEEVVVEEES